MLKSLSAVAVAVLLSTPSIAADPPINWNSNPQTSPAPQATIRFARQGGIDNWTVVDEKTVYVQDRERQWYRADLMGHCIGLRFAQRIGFKFEVDGSFDKFSSIHYDRQTCPLTSLTKSDPPPGFKGKLSPEAAARAAGAAVQKAEGHDPS